MLTVKIRPLLVAALTLGILAGCSGITHRQSGIAAESNQLGPGVPEFWVRPGYRVTLAVDNLQHARFLEVDDNGTLYISQPRVGNILSLKDTNDDGTYDQRAVFVEDRPTVHGMHFKDGWLWFSQTGSIHRARDTNGDGKADEIEAVTPEGELPSGGGHWWRSLLVTDDHIYTSIGDSGNIVDETDTERQKIWRFNKDGSGKQLFSSGIRNTEKLRLRPGTEEVWGLDHGSDHFGRPLGERAGQKQPVTDHNPPDEVNHYVEGGFYGHPFVVGTNLPRIEFHDHPDLLALAEDAILPEWNIPAHWAPNGFTFIKSDYFPDHGGDMFMALHGSWNSTTPVGYRIERLLFDDVTGKPYGSLGIVTCLTPGYDVLARPVDCVEEEKGTVLFSCDYLNKVFRISRIGD